MSSRSRLSESLSSKSDKVVSAKLRSVPSAKSGRSSSEMSYKLKFVI